MAKQFGTGRFKAVQKYHWTGKSFFITKDAMSLSKKKMPVKIGSKTYKGHNSAAKAVAKKKGLPIERAHAYVAVVERKQRGKKK